MFLSLFRINNTYQRYTYAEIHLHFIFSTSNLSFLNIFHIFVMQPDSTTTNPTPDISAIIADALKQQASQFEAIVNGLQAKISSLSVGASDSAQETTKQSKTIKLPSSGKITPSGSAKKPSKTPKKSPYNSQNPPLNPFSTPPAQKPPKKSSTSTKVVTPTSAPPRKRAPLQMLVDNTPQDFKPMKVSSNIYSN